MFFLLIFCILFWYLNFDKYDVKHKLSNVSCQTYFDIFSNIFLYFFLLEFGRRPMCVHVLCACIREGRVFYLLKAWKHWTAHCRKSCMMSFATLESKLLIIRILACGWEQGESKYNITIIISTCFSDRVHLQAGDLREGLSPTLSREAVQGPHHAILQSEWSHRDPEQHWALNCGCATHGPLQR